MYSCCCHCSVTQLCPILCDPVDCSLPGSFVHGILQAWILGWVAISSTRASSRPRDLNHVSCIGRPGFHTLRYYQEFAELMSTDSIMPSKHLILCCPLLFLSSVTQSCPIFCKPMYCSMPGFPVHHQLPQLAQTHVLQVSDAIQPFHPWLSPSPPDFSLAESGSFLMNQFFVSGGLSLEFQLWHQSFQWIFRTHFL